MYLKKSSGVLFKIFVLLVLIVSFNACNKEEARQARMVSVDYSSIKKEAVKLYTELPGRVSAFNVSEVRPQVTGYIQERLFEEGSDVTEGQVLYKIDPSLFQTAYNSAKANLEGKEAVLVTVKLLAERYEKLVKTAAISQQDYDNVVAKYKQAISDVDSAKQALEDATIKLGYTDVKSPISGRIGKSFVTQGALVKENQDQPLVTVQQMTPVYVDLTLSTASLLKFKKELYSGSIYNDGRKDADVRLKLEDGSYYVKNIDYIQKNEKPEYIKGKLLFSDVTVEQGTGSVTIRLSIENHLDMLLPGMYVTAVIEEGVMDGGILVPQSATFKNTRGGSYVYVLTKERPAYLDEGSTEEEKQDVVTLADDEYYVVTRDVIIARDMKNNWLIASGLEDGDKLLMNGFQKVYAGAIVSASEMQQEQSKEAEQNSKENNQ